MENKVFARPRQRKVGKSDQFEIRKRHTASDVKEIALTRNSALAQVDENLQCLHQKSPLDSDLCNTLDKTCNVCIRRVQWTRIFV